MPIAVEQLLDVIGVDRARVGHLHDEPVPRQDVLENLDLVQDPAEVRLERVVELDRDVTPGTEDPPELLEHFLEGREAVVRVGGRVVDEEVVDDARVARQVPDQAGERRDLVGVRGVDREDQGRRARDAVAVV